MTADELFRLCRAGKTGYEKELLVGVFDNPTTDLDGNAAWSDSHFDSSKTLDEAMAYVTVERKI